MLAALQGMVAADPVEVEVSGDVLKRFVPGCGRFRFRASEIKER